MHNTAKALLTPVGYVMYSWRVCVSYKVERMHVQNSFSFDIRLIIIIIIIIMVIFKCYFSGELIALS